MSAGTQDFSEALDDVLDNLHEGRPFALVRFNDGEYKACRGEPYTAVDGWRSSRGGWWLKDALVESLRYAASEYYVGVSAPCCGLRAAQWYSRQLRGQHTYGTIFNNANYQRAQTELAKIDAFRVSSSANADLQIPADCVTDHWDYAWVVDALVEATKPVFIAAGPLANVLICEAWKRRQDIALVDVGSIFDEAVLRAYQESDSWLQTHACSWVWKAAVAVQPPVTKPVVVQRPGGMKALKERLARRRARRRGS